MCDRAAYLSQVIDRVNALDGRAEDPLKRLQTKLFYAAPEIVYTKWKDLYTIMLQHFSDNADMCQLYNDAYNEYKVKFKN